MSDWMTSAACKGQTGLFFAPARERPPARIVRQAKAQAICDVCPVRSDCRETGADQHEFGIWGGAPEDVFADGLTTASRNGMVLV